MPLTKVAVVEVDFCCCQQRLSLFVDIWDTNWKQRVGISRGRNTTSVNSSVSSAEFLPLLLKKKTILSQILLFYGTTLKNAICSPLARQKSDDASKANLAKVLALQLGNYFHCQMIPLALQHSLSNWWPLTSFSEQCRRLLSLMISAITAAVPTGGETCSVSESLTLRVANYLLSPERDNTVCMSKCIWLQWCPDGSICSFDTLFW